MTKVPTAGGVNSLGSTKNLSLTAKSMLLIPTIKVELTCTIYFET